MEMIERVARAIRTKMFLEFPETEHLSSATVEAALARAAIEAMREPTEAMVDAGDESGMWGPGVAVSDTERDASPESVWRAMIDRALTPLPPSPDSGLLGE